MNHQKTPTITKDKMEQAMKQVCGTCNFNIESRAGSNSIETLCAYDNQWRKDSTPSCQNWAARSNALSLKDRIDIAKSKRQELLIREVSKKKWYEKPIGYVVLTVIATLIAGLLIYYLGWNGPKETKPQTTQSQKESTMPASNIPKKIPKKTP
jgi:hypothetical protein